ncbi:MAG: hypothetical protein LBG90_03065 [Spirochaetaceae bacterium]|jgi:hypothetical protein|nr:hypothetical protein [Spirochaetaceae bacterium]
MKKLFAVCIIGLTLGTAGAFADHPSGWGIGPGFGGNWGWIISSPIPGLGPYLSLKAPMLPIYWGLGLNLGSDYFGFGVSGDYYIIDKLLVEKAKLHWFLGVGGFLTLESRSGTHNYRWTEDKDYSYLGFGAGARVPVGLSWQPLDWLEVFGDIKLELGIGGTTKAETEGREIWDNESKKYTDHKGGLWFPVGGFGMEIGVRFWF